MHVIDQAPPVPEKWLHTFMCSPRFHWRLLYPHARKALFISPCITTSIFTRLGGLSRMALARVSRAVVIVGGSFSGAVFAYAGRGRGTRQPRRQVGGHSRRHIEWERRGSGALEAQRSDLFSYTHSCNSKLIRAPRGLSSRDQVRAAPFRDLYSASLLSRVAARRKLLALMQIIADALSKWSCSWAT